MDDFCDEFWYFSAFLAQLSYVMANLGSGLITTNRFKLNLMACMKAANWFLATPTYLARLLSWSKTRS
jgi:hypothetical protein